MLVSKGALLSLLAGALGAISGLLAKIGLDQDQISNSSLIPPTLLLPLRALLLLLTLASNCCMVAIYSRALQASPTSAEASLVNVLDLLNWNQLEK